MENIIEGFYKVRGDIATLHQAFQQGMDWWKKEMQDLKDQLSAKDKEIEELKKKLNEKSSK